jgi:hypothetical protein
MRLFVLLIMALVIVAHPTLIRRQDEEDRDDTMWDAINYAGEPLGDSSAKPPGL